jgi:8-oxo-dGTP pyrophosphatase MutT (NUDIX family)
MAEIMAARIEVSSGGVIYRRTSNAIEILLIKDSYGNWGFPKGHVEAGESSQEAALRECREETGLGSLRMVGPVGTSDWHFRTGKSLVHKFCDYFILEADPNEPTSPQRGEGIQACQWLARHEAEARVTYANARQILRVAAEYWSPSGASEPATPYSGPDSRNRGK